MNSNRRIPSCRFHPCRRSEYPCSSLPCAPSKKNGKEERKRLLSQTRQPSDLGLSRFPISFPSPIRISPSCFASLASQRLFSLWKQSASGDISPGCLIFSSSSFLLFHLLRGSSLSFPRLSARVFEKLYLHRREAREYQEILASPLGGRIHSSEGEAMAWSCRWPSNTVAQYPIIKLAGCYTALSFQYPPRLLIRVILHVAERVKGRIG